MGKDASMINGVTASGIRLDRRQGETVRQGAATAPSKDVGDQGAPVVGSFLRTIAAEGPPVDAEKVAAIRQAIAEGRYPVDPRKIAERMIALDLAQ